jgi:hypothetical protein
MQKSNIFTKDLPLFTNSRYPLKILKTNLLENDKRTMNWATCKQIKIAKDDLNLKMIVGLQENTHQNWVL